MRLHIPTRAIWAIFAVAAIALTSCTDSAQSVDEIVADAIEHAGGTTSYEVRTSTYLTPDDETATTSDWVQVQRPGQFRMLDETGEPRYILDGENSFLKATTQPNKWTRYSAERPANLDSLAVLLPDRFMDLELIDTVDGVYLIEGLGVAHDIVGGVAGSTQPFTLKIQSSGNEFVEITRWEYPIGRVDADGKIVEATVEASYEGQEHMRLSAEFSDYGSDFDIQLPAESEIIIELLRVWPPDNADDISVNAEFGFQLSESAPVTILEVTPEIPIVQTTDIGGYKSFGAPSSFDPATTYRVALSWGKSQDNLETTTWSFSTH